LAVLRRDAGPTQAQAARRIRYSRSAVARAEATGVCRRDLCSLAGQLYGAGNELAHEHDRIEALGAAARTLAAQQARQARHGDQPPAGIVAHAEETETAFTAVEAACPHCRKPVAVLLRHSTALLPVESPALPP
jgi:folate-binding Fe-S cluster repair protein YgfZ